MSAGSDDRRDAGLVRHEEQLVVGTREERIGSVHARRTVETERVQATVPRRSEEASVERVPPVEGDSGEVETLPDGSVSIPVLEEQLVVTKRLVVKERIIVRKQVEVEQRTIEGEVRRERVELDVDEGVEVRRS